jgi:glutamate racemase
LDDFDSLEEAQKAYPEAVVCACSTYSAACLDHLPEDGDYLPDDGE